MRLLVKKTIIFILSLIISVLITTTIIFAISKFNLMDTLFNYVLLISTFSSVVSTFIYQLIIRNEDLFFKILIALNFILFNMLYIYIGPLTVNRSLSTFIYFYTAENNSITKDIYNEAYFKDFVARRFIDGNNFGYLDCRDNNRCYANLKTKIFFSVLYPISIITGSDSYYKEFRNFINTKNKF